MPISHLLVATDGSEGARKAAAFAGELARACGARITVLMAQNDHEVISHAWGAGDYPSGAPWATMPVDQIREMLEQRVRTRELPETVAALGESSGAVESTMVWGPPAEQICRFAADHDVDLIVIGSHGRTGIKRALLGSVSHAVANQAPCPVTIVR